MYMKHTRLRCCGAIAICLLQSWKAGAVFVSPLSAIRAMYAFLFFAGVFWAYLHKITKASTKSFLTFAPKIGIEYETVIIVIFIKHCLPALAWAGQRGQDYTLLYRDCQEEQSADSGNTATALRSFGLQYKPRLDMFVDGGIRFGDFSGWYRHFGWSAGLTFSWTVFDGRQKRLKERQAVWQQNSIRTYKENSEYRRNMRIRQCLAELGRYDERERILESRLAEYNSALSDYGKEMDAGQVSVLDYITVLRGKVRTENDRLLLQTNRLLVIAAYNYWNW